MATLDRFKVGRDLIKTWDYDSAPDKAAGAKEHTDKVSDIYRQLDGGDELEALLDFKCNRFCADKAQQPAFLTGEDWEVPEDEEELELDPGARFPGRLEDDAESVATSGLPAAAKSGMSKSGTRARDLVSGRSVSGLAITKYSQLSAKARALDRSLFPLFRGTIKGEITKVITNSMCDGLYTKAVYLLYMHLGM